MKILSSSAALHLPTVNAPRSGQATKQSKSTDDETLDDLAHFRPSIDCRFTSRPM